MNQRPARFITLEGGEGAGKSTQLRRLVAALEAKGLSVCATREPGGSPGAETIRRLLVQGEQDKWDSRTETLLLFAARADHINRRIGPAIKAGTWVVCDRFTDSTYAYQGYGRGVPSEFIEELESLVLGNLRPDLTLVLDVDASTGLARTSGRALPLFDPSLPESTPAEAQLSARRAREEARFERFGVNFHKQLRDAFVKIAAKHPERCVVIDASQAADDVERAIWKVVSDRFGI